MPSVRRCVHTGFVLTTPGEHTAECVLGSASCEQPAAASVTGTGGQCPALPAGACQPPVERAIAMSLATWSGCGRHTTRSPRPCAVEHQHGVLCTMYLPADSIWVVCRCVRNPEIHLDMLAVSHTSAVVCANDGSAWKLQPYPATWVRVHPPSALLAPDGSRGAAAVAAACGYDHVVLLLDDGSMLTQGDDTFGATGRQPLVHSSSLMLPLLLERAVVQVACGHQHTLALTADGAVMTCGRNNCGQLGCGMPISDTASRADMQLIPLLPAVDGILHAAHVAAGSFTSLIATTCGQVLGWGHYTITPHSDVRVGVCAHLPKLVSMGPELDKQHVVLVSAGYMHAAAVTSSGKVWTWGDNTKGQLGHSKGLVPRSSTDYPPRPLCVQDASLAGHRINQVRVVSCGHWHTMAVAVNGSLWAWGQNVWAQCGTSLMLQCPKEAHACSAVDCCACVPRSIGQVPLLRSYVTCASSYAGSAAVDSKGHLLVCGRLFCNAAQTSRMLSLVGALHVMPPGSRTRCLLHDRWTEDDARFAVPLAQVRARYDMRNVHVNSLSMDLASESRFSIELFNGAHAGLFCGLPLKKSIAVLMGSHERWGAPRPAPSVPTHRRAAVSHLRGDPPSTLPAVGTEAAYAMGPSKYCKLKYGTKARACAALWSKLQNRGWLTQHGRKPDTLKEWGEAERWLWEQGSLLAVLNQDMLQRIVSMAAWTPRAEVQAGTLRLLGCDAELPTTRTVPQEQQHSDGGIGR